MARHSVGSTQDFAPNQVKVLRVGGERIGVVFLEGKYYAWEDRCTHDDGPLGLGPLEGCQIECPRHGARFDVRTGRVMAPPAFTPLDIFQTEVSDDQVYVILED
ncbi:non-heme iron oxygenase ferredoxin subunit [bacterium]|nr:non-heme iron oxygenase ferredoxin subunit [bacterium]